MPCTDGRTEAECFREAQECNLRGIVSNTQQLTNFMKECHVTNTDISRISSKIDDLLFVSNLLIERKDMLARLLCFVMNGLSPASQIFLCEKNPELKKWWESHQKFDKERAKCKQ